MSRRRTSPRGKGRDGYQAGPGMVVSFSYVLFDAEGEEIERSEPSPPLELLFGYGAAAKAFEQAIQGLAVGDAREVRLAPDAAFGPRDPDAIIEVDRGDLPIDILPGDELGADREDGEGSVLLRVIEVRDDVAVLDTNHPLAGQRIRLSVRIEAIRPASAEELEQAAERLLRGEEAENHGPLLPAERLLKRGRGEPTREGDEPPPPAPPPKRVA